MLKTPKLNGLAKKMKWMIMKRIRSMMSHVQLPKSYWAKAMYKVVYLINRSPSVPLKGDMRVFGCLVYMHVKTMHIHGVLGG